MVGVMRARSAGVWGTRGASQGGRPTRYLEAKDEEDNGRDRDVGERLAERRREEEAEAGAGKSGSRVGGRA